MDVHYKAQIVTCYGFSAPAFLAELLIFLAFSVDAGIRWLSVVHRFAVIPSEKFDEVQEIIEIF